MDENNTDTLSAARGCMYAIAMSSALIAIVGIITVIILKVMGIL